MWSPPGFGWWVKVRAVSPRLSLPAVRLPSEDCGASRIVRAADACRRIALACDRSLEARSRTSTDVSHSCREVCATALVVRQCSSYWWRVLRGSSLLSRNWVIADSRFAASRMRTTRSETQVADRRGRRVARDRRGRVDVTTYGLADVPSHTPIVAAIQRLDGSARGRP